MIKNLKAIVLSLVLLSAFSYLPATAFTNNVASKLIALDAGHGGTETGAINTKYNILEKDVNLAVVYALKSKLEANGALVVLTREGDETISSRKDRVDTAVSKCQTLAGRKCDILVSVHHNGNSDSAHDGTLVIYTQKSDVPLAKAMHDTLVPLTGIDEGYINGGYGMTVYQNLVSVLTETYYITNDSEAEKYLAGTRGEEEAQAQLEGINNYFGSKTGGGKGGGRK